MTYRKQTVSQYSRKKPSVATLKTRKWGKISYPKGTKPVVVEVKTNSSTSQIEGLGYKKESDVEVLKRALEKKGKAELEKHQKAEYTINFPKTKMKPVKFSVAGEQPVTPPVIHHPAWPPQENLVQEIKEEMRKKPNRKTASDLEAFVYMQSASGAGPFDESGYRVTFYLFRKYLVSKGWKKFEGNMAFLNEHKTLSTYDQRSLNRLKEQIFRDQQKVLKEREKQAKTLGK